VVEYRQFERVGGSHPVRVDARIIGATNADLPALAREGKFKRDLLDRLSFEVLFLPPLRSRREDIGLLARHFAARMAMELGWREAPEFSTTAIQALEAYPWPGNIRELKNVVERAVYASGGETIDRVNFDPFDNPYSDPGMEEGPRPGNCRQAAAGPAAPADFVPGRDSLDERVRALELAALRAALEAAQFHQGEAAKLVGLSYHQFRGLYRKHKEALEAATGA
jgi:psp operon transcriptional activator